MANEERGYESAATKRVCAIKRAADRAIQGNSEAEAVPLVLGHLVDMIGELVIQVERVADVAEGNSNTGVGQSIAAIARAIEVRALRG